MGNTRIAIEIDGEAICFDTDGETVEESDKAAERVVAGNLEKDEKPLVAAAVDGKELTTELLGQVVHSEEEAYRLYCDYGIRMGFSIRKGKQYYYTGTKNIRTKDYYCSKEGHKDDDSPAASAAADGSFFRPDTRTNCKAMIRFRVDDQGRWKVIRLISDHNHELVKPGERHMLRSARSLAVAAHGAMTAAGALPLSGDSLPGGEAAAESGDAECTSVDPFAAVQQQPSREVVPPVSPAESQGLVNYFNSKASVEGMFYWDVQVDDAGRMVNYYWRDGRSRLDYECFGDAVVIDMMQRLGGYDGLSCVQFIGVNHHLQATFFGCALLSDESQSSFEWLLRTFLDSMGRQSPRTAFTNLNPAMGPVMEAVLPQTRHCYSRRHVLGCLQSSPGASENCQEMFAKCLSGCDSTAEFEETWTTMVAEWGPEDHLWLADLYQQRHKWSTAFQKDVFTAGIGVWGHEDSLWDLFDEEWSPPSLVQFAGRLDNLVRTWRSAESEEDNRSAQGAPVCAIKHNLLKQAAEVYTHKVYRVFEADFLEGCGATSYQEFLCGSSGTVYKFEMVTAGPAPKHFSVLLDTSTADISCTCRRFETAGLLCSHALNALGLKHAVRIADRYILRRWTRFAKRVEAHQRHGSNGEEVEGEGGTFHRECTNPEEDFHNRAMLYVYDLMMRCKGGLESRRVLWEALDGSEKALNKLFEIKNLLVGSVRRDKDGGTTGRLDNKRKLKSRRHEKSDKSSKSKQLLEPNVSMLDPPAENQFFSMDEGSGRPFYYSGFAAAGLPGNHHHHHMYANPEDNVHSIPHCTSEDYSGYGTIHAATAGFDADHRNF